MKTLFSTLRFVLLPAAAFLTVSCKNKDADTNPYATDPYYGPQSGGSAYGSGGGGDYPDVQPTPPAYDSGGGGYTAPPPAPTYDTGGGSYSGGSTSGGGGGSSHTVVQGDTLYSLARRYNTSVSAIQSANGLTGTLIRTGQTLVIP